MAQQIKGVAETAQFMAVQVDNEVITLDKPEAVADIRQMLITHGIGDNVSSATAVQVNADTIRFQHENSTNG